jgi:small basic protein
MTTATAAAPAAARLRASGCPREGRPVAFRYGSPQVEAGRQVLVPLAGLLVGILLGLVLNVNVGYELARYSAVAILAALDSVLGAIRAELDGAYDNRIFISGFVTNAIVAVLLTFVGDRLGLDLYLVALITFGLRIFQNVALIRRHFL